MSFQPLKLTRLFFVGASVPTASVELMSGLNVIYGGSNAGKSFTLRAIDFMLGASKLELPEQGKAYTHAYLWLVFADGARETLVRSVSGGDFMLFDGHVDDRRNLASTGQTLVSTQRGKSKGQNRKSLSDYLFAKIGLQSAQILKNEVGEKVSLSIRMLSPYLLVGEGAMVTESSPFKSPEMPLGTQDKSLLRFLLTGKDDSNIAAVTPAENLKAAREGKIEILEEIISEISARLVEFERSKLEEEVQGLTASLSGFQEEAQAYQTELDKSRLLRRGTLDTKARHEAKISEHTRMLVRFAELRKTYISDVERLEALEEGSELLLNVCGQPCAVCGAEGVHQHHDENTVDLAAQAAAAAVEAQKIRVDLAGLDRTTASLHDEIQAIGETMTSIQDEVLEIDRKIEGLIPLEGSARARYEEAFAKRQQGLDTLHLFRTVSEHESRIETLRNQTIGRQRADGLPDPIGSSSGSEFSNTVLSVLKAWQFPQLEKVDFDVRRQDIVVNGRDRSGNGKGIRAILHSAVKVALLIYCKDNDLPHPGVLVLDSPLLTYRSPLNQKDHGAPEEDEVRVSQTNLNSAFYTHISSLSAFAQIIVLENRDPPAEFINAKGVQRWSGENGSGRQGFFPPLSGGTKSLVLTQLD